MKKRASMAKKRNAKSPQRESDVVVGTVEQADPIVRANIHRETMPATEQISLYANDTQLQISPWDFRFIFGVIASTPSPDNPTIKVQEVGEVRMSPQHAKKITQVLLQQIQSYERV